MQKLLLIFGGLVVLIGIFWPWLRHIPLGKLPGDWLIETKSGQFYFPLMTCILISIIVSLLLSWWR